MCLRAVRPEEIWRLIDEEGVTHLCGAPTVLSMLVNSPAAHPLENGLVVMTAAAPPNPTVLAQTEALGATVVHVYGLTETYGPYTVCQWQTEWADEEAAERARLLSRQGVAMVMADPIRVVGEDGRDVPRDGATVGEIVMSGNDVMKGYFDDPGQTAAAFRGGVFHSGDLGVWHPDGYIELRDRAKDVVISGGENISTIEVEQALGSHPAVLEAAVIGVPDERWGERPKAFVVLRPGGEASHDELTAHVRGLLAGRPSTAGSPAACSTPATTRSTGTSTAGRGDQPALIYDTPVTGTVRSLTYRELRDAVARFAGVLRGTASGKGDRVVIYMPMVPEAVIAMLACARLGAVHSVVFGGFAPHELAIRIDDARPKVVVSASCGIEGAGSSSTSRCSTRRSTRPSTSPRTA